MKKKRDKKHRQKPISRIGGLGLIAKHQDVAAMMLPLDDEQTLDLGIAYHMAFADMTNGRANEDRWSIVVCALNIALVLAERGFGDEYLSQIIKALDGAFRGRMRASKSGVWGFDGDAIAAIQLALDIHTEQVKIVTREEMRQALFEVRRRIEGGNTYSEAA